MSAKNTQKSTTDTSPRTTPDSWRHVVQTLYPDLTSRTYCVPPVYFTRVPYTRDTVGHESVLVLTPPTNPSGQATAQSATQPSGQSTAQPSSQITTQPSGQTTTQPSGQTSTKSSGQTTTQPRQATVQALDQNSSQEQGQTSSQGSDTATSNQSECSVPEGMKQEANSLTDPSKPAGLEERVRNVLMTVAGGFSDGLSDLGLLLPGLVPSSSPGQQAIPAISALGGDFDIQGLIQNFSGASEHSMWSQDPNPSGKPTEVYDSDTREDEAQQHVLFCLQELGQQEVMFILSQLNFGDYLNQPSYAAATANLPRPSDLPSQDRRGDFDVLIIHRRYGILIGEIKSIGRNEIKLNKTEVASEVDLAKRIERAVKQLEKSEKVVKHIVSDVQKNVMVRKTVILPYITMDQLQRVIDKNPKLKQNLSSCLGASREVSAAQLCLCADQMSDRESPWHVSPVLSQLKDWWKKRMTCKQDPAMSDEVYLDLVSRVVGPATTVDVHCVVPPRVEVRTEGEAVSEVGERMARLVLTPEQVSLVNREERMVCLSGPPGTGKTLLLVLIGLVWLVQGHDVHVVSVWLESLASSLLVYHQLQMTLRKKDNPANVGKVYFHHYDLDSPEADVQKAVTDLTATESDELYVLMDEASFYFDKHTERMYQLIEALRKAKDLHLWAASLHHMRIPPCLTDRPLTVPLRCPPIIHRQVAPSASALRILGARGYVGHAMPSPADGPDIIRLRHQGQGHVGLWPIECFSCGQKVADVLRQLQVGVSGANVCPSTPPPLRYRDVFVMTVSAELCDDITDDMGQVTSNACHFVRGMRKAGIAVKVLTANTAAVDVKTLEKDVADVAVAKSDAVTVTDFSVVRGLERKVVVLLPGRAPMANNFASIFYNAIPDEFDRIRTMSRCTSQLIVVEMPSQEELDLV